MNIYEWSPGNAKPRMTRSQIRDMKKKLQKWSKIAQKVRKLEELEREQSADSPEDILKQLDEV